MDNKLNHLWDQVLEFLEKELSRLAYDTFISPIKPVAFLDDTLVIEVPDDYTKDWLENRYISLIKEVLFLVIKRETNIKISTPGQISEKISSQNPFSSYNGSAESSNSVNLNPRYTFDTFVVGNSNRFAHAASLAVADSPAKAYNPLFIYGGVGLGKTHLMHAIGHHILENNPKVKVAYVSSEKFTNELINSIRDDKTVEFRNTYRNVDILLVDDIQFLAGKERTQEEFFHTFNALHEENKQIILSSDRPPKEIPTLEDRLRSRFEWGLITDIQPPDLETRIAILRKKAKLENLSVSNDVMAFIANKIQSNIRELEGALIRVMAFSSLTNNEITPELAAEALKDIFPPSKQKKITIDLIQQIVAEFYNLRIDELKAKKRTRTISYPRQIAMYLCRELTTHSLPKIGEEFGGRDHTTVIHAHDKIANNLLADPFLKNTITEITDKIQG